MEANNQLINPKDISQTNEAIQKPAEQIRQPKTNRWLVPTLTISLILSLGISGIFAYQNFKMVQEKSSQTKLEAEKKQKEQEKITETVNQTTSPIPTPKVIVKTVAPPEKKCLKTFSSRYVSLQFDYDDCSWDLEEKLIEPEAGIFSTIKATHISNHKVEIQASTVGMGGGYPDCSLVEDVYLLDNNIVRLHLIGAEKWKNSESKYYLYLSKNNDYAIKGYEGKFGNDKFDEYFTFLNKEMYQNSNMCWREGGMNIVAALEPKENQVEQYQINKDITIQINEEVISDQNFLFASDALAVEVFSYLFK